MITLFVSIVLNGETEQIPYRHSQELPAIKTDSTLRIFEYNICGKLEYYAIHTKPEFYEYILNQNADILFLPENTAGVSPELENALKEEYPFSLHSFPEFEQNHSVCADYTLYSRLPLSNYKNYKLDNRQFIHDHPYLDSLMVMSLGTHFMAYEVTADIDNHPITLLHVHLRTNSYDTARSEGDTKRKQAHNVIDRLLLGYAFREAEAKVIVDSLANCPNPLIICGDFNDLSGSRALSMIQNCRRFNSDSEHGERLRDAWWEGGQGFGFTYADQHLRLRLDHILYSKEFKLKGVKVDDVEFSDHRPLIADFAINDL